MKEITMSAPLIFGITFAVCSATAVATGLVIRKLEKEQARTSYPSAEDSELYKF